MWYYLVPAGTGFLGSLLGYGLLGFVILKLLPAICLLLADVVFVSFSRSSFKHFILVTLAFLGVSAIVAALIYGCVAGTNYFMSDSFFLALLLFILIFLLGIGELVVLIFYFIFLQGDIKYKTDDFLFLWGFIFTVVFFILDYILTDVTYFADYENSTCLICIFFTIPALFFAIFRHWDVAHCLGFDFMILSASFCKYFCYISKEYNSFDFKEYGLFMAIAFGVLFIPSLIPGIINAVKNRE